MRPEQYPVTALEIMLKKQKVATIEEIKKTLGTDATMTAFRKLKQVGYCTSYSHSGKYYALKETVRYDRRGLWAFGDAYFSKYGTLKETLKFFIDQSERGYTGFELTSILKVDAGRTLRELHREKSVARNKFEGVYVYYTCKRANKRRQQELLRQSRSSRASDEVKAGIIIFYSLLDEKERRLFGGLESLRMGHGGDVNTARLLGLDVHSVAKGRRELLDGDCDVECSRSKGAGRSSVKKNTPGHRGHRANTEA